MKTDLDTLAEKTIANLTRNYQLAADLMLADAAAGHIYGAYCQAMLASSCEREELVSMLGLLVRREMVARQKETVCKPE